MPEATITIAKVWTGEGTHQGRDWKKWDVQPEEDPDARYTTFNEDVGAELEELEGQRVKFEYDVKNNRNRITRWKIAQPEGDSPGAQDAETAARGTPPARATRQAPHPDEQRSIWASVALEQAVNTVAFCNTGSEVFDAAGYVDQVANGYFATLKRLAAEEKDLVDAEDIPF